MPSTLNDLTVKLFTDGADKAQIVEMARNPWIRGFTTNPSLLRKAGVSDYEAYARDLVAAVPDRHISFEVFSDDIPDMIAQARVIARWGDCLRQIAGDDDARRAVVRCRAEIIARGDQYNMTAIFTDEQVDGAISALADSAPACVSVFAGRLADFGHDYGPTMEKAVKGARRTANVEIIWASTREVFNVVEADRLKCHIITAPADVLKGFPALGPRARKNFPSTR